MLSLSFKWLYHPKCEEQSITPHLIHKYTMFFGAGVIEITTQEKLLQPQCGNSFVENCKMFSS